MLKRKWNILLLMIVVFGVGSLLATGGGEEKKHSPVDANGTWQYFYTDQYVPGYKGPYLAIVEQSGVDFTVSIESIGSGSGTVSESAVSFSCATGGGGTFNAEGTADPFTMDGNWADSGGGAGNWWAEKGSAFGHLIHNQTAQYPWRLVVTAYAKDATSVYVTGDHIDGDYELFSCRAYGGYEIWESANDAGCENPNSGYILKDTFSFPLYVTVHFVTSSGTDTEEITVNGYDEEF